MNQGTYQLAAGMLTNINRLNVITNNLSNSNTNGFKQDNIVQGSFNHYLDKASKENKTPDPISTILNTIPNVDRLYTDPSQGNVISTGNKLDFSINQPNIFFKLQGDNGEVLLTRDGSFNNQEGILVNKQGMPVLDNNNNVIAIEDGPINLNLSLIKTSHENLNKKEGNLYTINNINEITPIENNDTYIDQGFLEKSNVNTLQTMVMLIETQRHFAQLQKVREGIGETSKAAVTDLGRA